MMKFLFTFTILLASTLGWAQSVERWGLERCIDYAIEHNIQVQQQQTSVVLSKLSLDQSKWDYSPSLSAGASYNANFGRSLDPTTYSFIDGQTVNNVNGSVTLSTQAFGGMRKLHTMKQSQFNLLASMQDVLKIKNEITLAVAAAYLDILYTGEQITNSNNQIAVINTQIERTQKLVAAGSVAIGALLELEAQKATEQYNLVSYQGQYNMALLQLTQLLEMRNAENFQIEIPNTDSLPMLGVNQSTGDIFESALNLPQIVGDKIRVQAADKAIDIARSKLYPTIDVGAQFGSSFSDARQKPMFGPDGQTYYAAYPFFDQLGDNASTAIQVSLGIPIFNGLTARRGVSRAKVQHLQSRLKLALSENTLYKEIGQALTDAKSAIERYNAAKSSVTSTQQAFDYASNKFDAGAINSVEYNTAKNNLIKAQLDKTQAKYEYIFKTKILDFYQGIPITL